jgi:hypothetical protein
MMFLKKIVNHKRTINNQTKFNSIRYQILSIKHEKYPCTPLLILKDSQSTILRVYRHAQNSLILNIINKFNSPCLHVHQHSTIPYVMVADLYVVLCVAFDVLGGLLCAMILLLSCMG